MIEDSVDGVALDRDRMMILSLRPRFADAILSGAKTVELRRTEPRIRVPTRALVYASTPVRALLGTCVVTSVESGDLGALWQAHGAGSGLDHGEFLRYFEGVGAGSALSLASPRRFSRPIPLVELRSRPTGFRPPQSFSYVDAETGNRLLELAALPPERTQGAMSRSAVVCKAVGLLRAYELGSAYEEAWREWFDSGEDAVWETAVGDGIA